LGFKKKRPRSVIEERGLFVSSIDKCYCANY